MAAGVRFTKAERDLLIQRLNPAHQLYTERDLKTAEGIIDKLELSELVKKKTAPGIGWVAAADAMKAVLGGRLTLPPKPSDQWCIWMSTRIRALGLTAEDCRKIAQNVTSWRGNISFETLIKGADKYLAAPTAPATTGRLPIRDSRIANRPVEATEDE